MKDLEQDQWRSELENDSNAVLLDVRTDEEVEEGYIPNAKHLDIYKSQEFLEELDKLDKEKTYYVYCRSGNRSGQACVIMDQKGFKDTKNLKGGFSQWEGPKTS